LSSSNRTPFFANCLAPHWTPKSALPAQQISMQSAANVCYPPRELFTVDAEFENAVIRALAAKALFVRVSIVGKSRSERSV